MATTLAQLIGTSPEAAAGSSRTSAPYSEMARGRKRVGERWRGWSRQCLLGEETGDFVILIVGRCDRGKKTLAQLICVKVKKVLRGQWNDAASRRPALPGDAVP